MLGIIKKRNHISIFTLVITIEITYDNLSHSEFKISLAWLYY